VTLPVTLQYAEQTKVKCLYPFQFRTDFCRHSKHFHDCRWAPPQVRFCYAPQLVPAGTAEAHISYGNSVCPSVRLSVRLSVTTRWYTKPRWDRDSGSSPYDSLESLVSYEVIWCQWVRRFPSNEGIKEGYPPLWNRYFTTIGSFSVKTVADRHILAAYHNKHCRRAFQWYQHRWPWSTLNPPNRGF